MNHQIAFVGGQLLPVFIGIKEFAPDNIYFIVSQESKGKISLLKNLLIGKQYSIIVCDPFEFDSIKSSCLNILNNLKSTDTVQFNLTGGTKIMVLAAQSLIQEKKLTGFYINQNSTKLHLPSYIIEKVKSHISIQEFLEISGHKLSRYKTINDFTSDDYNSIDTIDTFSLLNQNLILQINSKVRKTYDKLSKIPTTGFIEITKSTTLNWSAKSIDIVQNGINIFHIHSPNVRNLFFHASWWELIVARAISQWPKAKELLLQCELPFKSDTHTTKNEIDVLVNLGDKLIFIECKSGMVKQEDINKMRVVKDTYGGVISKSVLVSRFKPSNNIIEKCNELDIDVFFLFDNKIEANKLNNLIVHLEKVETKLSL